MLALTLLVQQPPTRAVTIKLKLTSWKDSPSVGPVVSATEQPTSGHLMVERAKSSQIPLTDTWQRHLV